MKTCPECGRQWPDEAQFCGVDAAALVDSSESEPEELIVGQYRILERLGAGGMGAVYVGEHLSLGRRDAIKMLNRSFAEDPDALARFQREAKNACTILHENVCVVYNFGETPDGLSFLAMELVDGVSLEELIEQEGGSLEPARAADIVGKVSRGLQAAHDRSIVHRDLKPGNVMVAPKPDGSDAVKVVDFGIAKAVDKLEDQQITRVGLVAGTREYMAPEHLRGEEADPRSDIYALGVVLFRTLTGQFPFTKDHPGPQPRRLTEAMPGRGFPPGLQQVIDRALQHDPKKRFPSARSFGDALVEALRPAVTGRPASASRSDVDTVIGAPVTSPTGAPPATPTGTPAGAPIDGPPGASGGAPVRAGHPPHTDVDGSSPGGGLPKWVYAAVAGGVVAAAGVGWFVAQGGSGGTLVLEPSDLELPAGGTLAAQAFLEDRDGSRAAASSASWTSDDPTLVRVDGSGVLTAGTGVGTTNLVVATETDTVRAPLRVVAAEPDSILLLGPTRMGVGDGARFEISAFDAFGNVIEDPEVSWSSSRRDVLEIDANGNARGEGAGSAVLIVALSGDFPTLSRDFDVTVAGGGSGDGGGNRGVDPPRPSDPDAEARRTLVRLCQEGDPAFIAWARGEEFDASWASPALASARSLYDSVTDPELRAAAAQVATWANWLLDDESSAGQWDARSGGPAVNSCSPLTGSGP